MMTDDKQAKEEEAYYERERRKAPIIQILEATEARILELAQSQLEDALFRQESPILDMSSDEVVELALVTAASIFVAFPMLRVETENGMKGFYSAETGFFSPFLEMATFAYNLKTFNAKIARARVISEEVAEAQTKEFADLIVDMYQELMKPKSKKKKSGK